MVPSSRYIYVQLTGEPPFSLNKEQMSEEVHQFWVLVWHYYHLKIGHIKVTYGIQFVHTWAGLGNSAHASRYNFCVSFVGMVDLQP